MRRFCSVGYMVLLSMCVLTHRICYQLPCCDGSLMDCNLCSHQYLCSQMQPQAANPAAAAAKCMVWSLTSAVCKLAATS